MALRELNLFVDLDQGRLVQGFTSTLQAVLPRVVFGDSIPVSVRGLLPNTSDPALPWREVDLTGQSVRIAIGTPAGQPKSGTFTLTFDGDTTSALAYNATDTQVAGALNLLASIIAAGGVSVTRSASGIYRIIFDDVGAKTDITADAASLYPSVDAGIFVALEGDASTRQVVIFRLETQPACYAELTDELPVAAASITVIRAGATGVSEIQSIEFSPEAYDGTYSIQFGSAKSSAIAFDAQPSEIQSALELLTGIGVGNVIVSGGFPRYTVEFAASLGDVSSMIVDVSGLVVPEGRRGSLNTNTSGIIELLDGASQANAKLEIEIFDISESTAWTAIQADCTVIDDVIGNSPGSQTPLPSYADMATVIARTSPLEMTAPPVDGSTDAVYLGQPAIVTTTNASGDFEDVWTCSNLSPMTWQPPGNIFRDRTTGTLYRQYFNAGSPFYELAYP